MSEKVEESLEIQKKKAEMVYNRCVSVIEDVYGKEITRDMKENDDEILGVVLLLIRDKGYSRLNSELIPTINYMKALALEFDLMEALARLHLITGKRDFRGMNI